MADKNDPITATCYELSWHRFGRGLEAAPEMWPDTIRMTETVRPYEGMGPGAASLLARDHGATLKPAKEGTVYPATSNRLGAVCAVVDGRLLGVKPAEFEVVTWRADRPKSDVRS